MPETRLRRPAGRAAVAALAVVILAGCHAAPSSARAPRPDSAARHLVLPNPYATAGSESLAWERKRNDEALGIGRHSGIEQQRVLTVQTYDRLSSNQSGVRETLRVMTRERRRVIQHVAP